MTALQDVVGMTNDALVITTVVQLMRSGRLTWCGKTGAHLHQSWPEVTWPQPWRLSCAPGATASAGKKGEGVYHVPLFQAQCERHCHVRHASVARVSRSRDSAEVRMRARLERHAVGSQTGCK